MALSSPLNDCLTVYWCSLYKRIKRGQGFVLAHCLQKTSSIEDGNLLILSFFFNKTFWAACSDEGHAAQNIPSEKENCEPGVVSLVLWIFVLSVFFAWSGTQ